MGGGGAQMPTGRVVRIPHKSWNLTIWNQETRLEPRAQVCLGQWGGGDLESRFSLAAGLWLQIGGRPIKVEEETIPASQGSFRVQGHSFCCEEAGACYRDQEATERSGQEGSVMNISSDFRIEGSRVLRARTNRKTGCGRRERPSHDRPSQRGPPT